MTAATPAIGSRGGVGGNQDPKPAETLQRPVSRVTPNYAALVHNWGHSLGPPCQGA